MTLKQRMKSGISVLTLIEILVFQAFKGIGISAYLFFWMFIYILLFIANTFGLYGNSYVNIVHTGVTHKNKYNDYEFQNDLSKEPKKKIDLSGLLKPSNYVYMVMFSLNLFLYMVIQLIMNM